MISSRFNFGHVNPSDQQRTKKPLTEAINTGDNKTSLVSRHFDAIEGNEDPTSLLYINGYSNTLDKSSFLSRDVWDKKSYD